MTFLLVSVVYAVAISKPGHGNIGPLAIGYTLFASAFIGGPLTGAALNPARVFGPALIYNCYWASGQLHPTCWQAGLLHVHRALAACTRLAAVSAEMIRWRLALHAHAPPARPSLLAGHRPHLHHRRAAGGRCGRAAGSDAVSWQGRTGVQRRSDRPAQRVPARLPPLCPPSSCAWLPARCLCPTRRYGPGPEHGGEDEHEALQSVQLAGGTPLPQAGSRKEREERAGLVSVSAHASSQRPTGW